MKKPIAPRKRTMREKLDQLKAVQQRNKQHREDFKKRMSKDKSQNS